MSEDPASQNLETPALIIDILVPENAWLKDLPNLEVMVKQAAEKVLRQKEIYKYAPGAGMKPLEVSFCFAGDGFVQKLNHEYRGRDMATNVLSFPAGFAPLGQGGLHLGDVVLAYGVVRREAREQNKSLPDHVLHLVVHGLLHLLGFDHGAPDEAREMEDLEKTLLKTFGIKDPYA